MEKAEDSILFCPLVFQKKVVEQLRKELLVKQEPEAKLQLQVQTPIGGDMKPANLLQSQQIPGGLQQVGGFTHRSQVRRLRSLSFLNVVSSEMKGFMAVICSIGPIKMYLFLPFMFIYLAIVLINKTKFLRNLLLVFVVENVDLLFISVVLLRLISPETDADCHASSHHQDSTSGAESCHHACPAWQHPVAAPDRSRYGNHNYCQTRLAECPHQPAGGQQADQSEPGTYTSGLQERCGGKKLLVAATAL